jgi:hypothetical protein
VEWPVLGPVQRLLRRHQYTRRFRSHDRGLVGFVKQLVDEVGIADILHPEHGIAEKEHRRPVLDVARISHVLYSPGVVLVFKA